MADPLRHRQTKGAATDMVDLTPPRHIPTLPIASVRASLRRVGSRPVIRPSGYRIVGNHDPCAHPYMPPLLASKLGPEPRTHYDDGVLALLSRLKRWSCLSGGGVSKRPAQPPLIARIILILSRISGAMPSTRFLARRALLRSTPSSQAVARMPSSGRPLCGFGSFCAETSLLVIADEDIKRRMRAAPAVGEVTGRDGYREAGEWQQAGGDQRDRAAQKVFARAGSRKPRSDQHQCSTTDNHGYRRLAP
jgi:hypothetical protein